MSAEHISTAIQTAKARWEESTVKPYISKFPERSEVITSSPERLYTPDDVFDIDYLRDIGFPGQAPFTRGKFPTMYRSGFWTQGLYSGYGRPEDANERIKFLLGQGDNTIRLAYDLPTQLGLDSDHPMAGPEVGKIGVACDSLADIERLFDGIPMDRVPIMGSINNPHIIIWAMYVAAAEMQGLSPSQLRGVVVSDFVQEYIGRGTYIFSPEGCTRLSVDFIEYATANIPGMQFEINAYTIREKGSTAAQEGAYAIATGLYFIEEARGRGISIDDLKLGQWEFHLACHMNFFEEIAKCRALRKLWAKIISERYSPRDPETLAIRIGPTSGGSTLTAQQPENNIVRVAIQLLATVLGGANFTKTSCYDEALSIPTPKAHRISLMTQHIVAYETGIPDVVDPLGGSYYIERLTRDMEMEIAAFLDEIEKQGGIVAATLSGWFQRRIAAVSYKRQKEIDEGRATIVGVNKFKIDEKIDMERHVFDESVAEEMQTRLTVLRRNRDASEVQRCLDAVEQAARGDDNLFPYVLAAVKAYATVGEICEVFRRVFGEYRTTAELL